MAGNQESGEQQYSEIKDIAGMGRVAGVRAARAAARHAGTGGAALKAFLASAGTALAPVLAVLFIVLVVVVILLIMLMALVGGRAAAQGRQTSATSYSVSAEGFLSAVDAVYQRAYNEGWHYGNSQSTPPCEDGWISCDRIAARALYDMGYTDQPPGGVTCGNIEEWCLAHGFIKITDQAQLMRGDIVYVECPDSPPREKHPHVFVLTEYDPGTGLCGKYDTGDDSRLRQVQPYKDVPLNQWESMGREFCYALRITDAASQDLSAGTVQGLPGADTTAAAVSGAADTAGTFTTLDDRKVTASGKGGEIIFLASRYVGCPYVWGGDSLTEGIDCSHFIARILAMAGVWDGHWVKSTSWKNEGLPVAGLELAQAGDVIVYDGHVALYDGAGYIYEAKGSAWGITHDRRADCKTILAIRRMPGAGNAAVRCSSLSPAQAKVSRDILAMAGEEMGIPFAGTVVTLSSYSSDVTQQFLDRFGLDDLLGPDGISQMERAWAGRAVTTSSGPEVQASYFWDPMYGDGERGLGVLANEGYEEWQAKFFETLAPMVKSYADKYGLCTSFVMTKCVCESGWIKGDRLGRVNNVFGMNVEDLSHYDRVVPPAWASYRTEAVFTMTHPGGSTADRAKTYRTLNDGIEDFCAVMAEHYPALQNTTDPHEEMIITSGYTESTGWIDASMNLINRYDLARFD